jgi:hypothetical protein
MSKLIATLLFVAWMYAALTANWTAVGALTVMIVIVETKGK